MSQALCIITVSVDIGVIEPIASALSVQAPSVLIIALAVSPVRSHQAVLTFVLI